MASSALEKEFVKVISDITKEISDEVVKNNALKSVEKLNENIEKVKKEYAVLLDEIEKNKRVHKKELDILNKDLAGIKEKFNQENKALVKEINDARNNYTKSSSMLLKDIKGGEELLNKSSEKIKSVLENLDLLIKTWDSNVKKYKDELTKLTKQVDLLDVTVREEIKDLKKLNESSYDKIETVIIQRSDSINTKIKDLDEQCKSISYSIVKSNDMLIEDMSSKYNDITSCVKNMDEGYKRKYNYLMAVCVLNVIMLIVVLWHLMR